MSINKSRALVARRWVLLVGLVGSGLAACAPGYEDATSAAQAIEVPAQVVIERGGSRVTLRVMASSPDAAGLRTWWLLADGVAATARVRTLAEALTAVDQDASLAGPASTRPGFETHLLSTERTGEGGKKELCVTPDGTLSFMGIGGGGR